MKLLDGLLLLGLHFYTDLEFGIVAFFPNVQAIYFDGIEYCAYICYPRFLSTYFTFVIRSSFTGTSQRTHNFAVSILVKCLYLATAFRCMFQHVTCYSVERYWGKQFSLFCSYYLSRNAVPCRILFGRCAIWKFGRKTLIEDFRRFRIRLFSFVMSVCPSAYISSATTGRNFVIFISDTFIKTCLENPNLVKIGKTVGNFTLRSKYVCVVNSNIKTLSNQMNPLLRLHGSSFSMYVVESVIWRSTVHRKHIV
jgi:hypothetical protein